MVPVKCVRPRARVKLGSLELKAGQRIMVNYNYDEPEQRGYWYDAVVQRADRKNVTATVFIGSVKPDARDLPTQKCSGVTSSVCLIDIWDETLRLSHAWAALCRGIRAVERVV